MVKKNKNIYFYRKNSIFYKILNSTDYPHHKRTTKGKPQERGIAGNFK